MCSCDQIGSTSSYCEPSDGQCQCRRNFGGRDCGQCEAGFYDYPSCTGQYIMVLGITFSSQNDYLLGLLSRSYGRAPLVGLVVGYFDPWYPTYYHHQVSLTFLDRIVFTKMTITVLFKQSKPVKTKLFKLYIKCMQLKWYFLYLLACDCDQYGSTPEICDIDSGICLCRENYGGARCDRCDVGFTGYPDCVGKKCRYS